MDKMLLSLKDLLMKHEGLRLKVYTDTAGIATIGCGRNLEDVGITREEAMYLLDNDIKRVLNDCWHHLPWFGDLSQERQYVIIDMVFNLGIHGFLKFKKMIAAIEKENWQEAAREMINSQWAAQVGQRAAELAAIMAGKD
jgi:lysozyme